MKGYTVREFQKTLKAKGYCFVRQSGSHKIWSNGKQTISVPMHKKEINGCLAQRLEKEM